MNVVDFEKIGFDPVLFFGHDLQEERGDESDGALRRDHGNS